MGAQELNGPEEHIDYLDKYRPMLHLLNSEEDFDYLASSGYGVDVAQSYRDIRRSSLRIYLTELVTDYQLLYRRAVESALNDSELAYYLDKARRQLKTSERAIHRHLLVDMLIPEARHSRLTRIGRRLLMPLFPRAEITRQLLVEMNTIGKLLSQSHGTT